MEYFLRDEGCSWVFNPPHSFYMVGNVWLGSLWEFSTICTLHLDSYHMKFCPPSWLKLLAIVNAHPIVPVSSDPDGPSVLIQGTLLTQKVGVPTAERSLDRSTKKTSTDVTVSFANTFWHKWKRDYLSKLQSFQSGMHKDKKGELEGEEGLYLLCISKWVNKWLVHFISFSFQIGLPHRLPVNV